MSRKYVPKSLHFKEKIHPKKEVTLFNIEGTGSFQRLEIGGNGSVNCMITLLIDNEVFLDETFQKLHSKSSKYITKYVQPNPLSNTGQFGIEINLPITFFKKVRLYAKADMLSEIEGTVQYTIHEDC